MWNEYRKEGLFWLLPAKHREEIYTRVDDAFEEIYDSLLDSRESVRILEDILSRMFRGESAEFSR